MTSTRNILKGGLASAALCTAVTAHSVTLGTFDNTTVKLGGYVKLDALYTSYDGSYSGLGRDFYVPSTTPVSGSSHSYFDMHARQTRVHLATDSKAGGKKLKSYIEIDFMVLAPPGADERISNSYSPRLRHAYIEYDNWLFGQTWSTFQNVASLPETVDFIGNTDAGIFVRQPQIRYTAGNLQFSIENPETTVNTGAGTIITDDNKLPDFVGRYNHKQGDLSLVGALLLRQLTMDQAGVDDTEMSYGISITGKVMLDKDDIRFGLNIGSGMGRYIGLNVSPGAVVNGNNLDAIDSTGLFASFRHHWDDKWRSNFTYSRIDIDNDTTLTGGGATESTASMRANLLFNWAKNLTLGGELALANREIESGADGDMTRLQFMAMYKF
ncbi:MAG: DcaP family trimeric outer membrane transporter [Gammaproteobacteria bacterium]|jgi:hypothetical protein